MDSIIKSIYEGKTLTEGEGRTLFEAIFEGKVAPVALAGILTALKMRGEKPEEIAGAAAAMRGAALPFPRSEGLTIGEIVGTGGGRNSEHQHFHDGSHCRRGCGSFYRQARQQRRFLAFRGFRRSHVPWL